MKPEFSVTQISAMTHPYKWGVGDEVISGKKYF